MARALIRHVQQELRFTKTKKGGKRRRKGGRPPKGPRSSERHEVRSPVRRTEPVHVVCRVVRDVGALRKRKAYAAVRRALVVTFAREGFRVVHLSIQGTHLHLLVEADDRMTLARGMQALQISAAKHLNAACGGRRGTVFSDRYHAESITSPKQTRNTLAYVLNNWRKHGEHRVRATRAWSIDLFSSATSFDGWLDHDETYVPPPTYERLPVHAPRSWLLRTGWRRHGLIGVTEVPSSKRHTPAE